jgi:hypothetical protein
MAQLGSALVDFGRTDTCHAAANQPRVRALVVYNSNPASNYSEPVESRGRTTFLEHTDIYLAYGHYYIICS